MRLVTLNEIELAFCARVAKERERFAVGYLLQREIMPVFRGEEIEVGTPRGDALMKEEEEVHRQGVTGEVAFCKHFDIYYPNRMRRCSYKASIDDWEWEGDPKDADVSTNVEVRTIGPGVGTVNVKERDNSNFCVVGIRRLNQESSAFRILGYFPVLEAQDRTDWKAQSPYKGFQVPVEMLRPIELMPFEGTTLGEYECERRDRTVWKSDSPYKVSLYVHHAIEPEGIKLSD